MNWQLIDIAANNLIAFKKKRILKEASPAAL
jgi:hypothetical protein